MRSNSTLGSRPSLYSTASSFPSKFLVLASLLIPYHSISASKANQYQSVLTSNKLTVVAVANKSTVFENDQFQYGFGYDLVRDYAQDLNVQLDFKTVEDDAMALALVAQGKANFAMTTSSMPIIADQALAAISVSCGDSSSLVNNGLDHNLRWVFQREDDQLTELSNQYVCQSQQNGRTQQLASFYSQQIVKEDDWVGIQNNLIQRMPIFEASFKASAQQYDLDWHLLAAIGYQESYLDPTSVSPTGVRGLMMLTNTTAQAMGVNNREDASQSIQGGAKYYDLMLSKYQHIPLPDRNWFALAAYNMGPGAVSKIQREMRSQGINPDNWINFYDFLKRNQAKNSRYTQAVQYVTRIRTYLEHIKTSPKLLMI